MAYMAIVQKTCLVCSRLFEKPSNCSQRVWHSERKSCSKECQNKLPRSEETRKKMRLRKLGKPSWNKGVPHTEEHKAHLRKKHKKIKDTSKMCGRRPWNKIGEFGKRINEKPRRTPEYKRWRLKVFERDDYTCQNCGKRGGSIQADHIKPFSLFPELRTELSNGRTLCVPCHKEETKPMYAYFRKRGKKLT